MGKGIFIRSVTLIELLLATALLSLVVLGGSQLYVFSHVQLLDSMRWTEVQNEVSYALEHMAGNIVKGIGDVNHPAVDLGNINSDKGVKIYIDANNDGLRNDYWIAYRSRLNTGAGAQKYEFWYCARCGNSSCTNCATGWRVLSRKITDFQCSSSDNYIISVQIQARWKPTKASDRENPEVMMQSNIRMPSVSLN